MQVPSCRAIERTIIKQPKGFRVFGLVFRVQSMLVALYPLLCALSP